MRLSLRMTARRALALATCSLTAPLFLGGCDPYKPVENENVALGAVDPVTFPAANLGDGGNRMMPGSGTFVEAAAFAGGQAIGYFMYPVNTPSTRDPLRLVQDGMPYLTAPPAYVFDSTDTSPYPDTYACTPRPAKPTPEQDPIHNGARTDPFPGYGEQQGDIFTALPVATYNPGVASATTYIPVVSEVKVSSQGETCQSLVSQQGLMNAMSPLPDPSGRYLAWLIIDPAAAVYPKEDPSGQMSTGIELQKWGWYKRYLVGYLDGGYIPTMDADVMGGMPVATHHVTKMVPQKLYHPLYFTGTDPTTMMAGQVPVALGDGHDVLTAKRGAAGYSPLCQVFTYDPGMGTTEAQLPKDAATIETKFAASLMADSPALVYCLQVR